MILRAIIHQLVYSHAVLDHPALGELMVVGRRMPWRYLLGPRLRVFTRPHGQDDWTEIDPDALASYGD